MKSVCKSDSCAGCMACVEVCPKQAIKIRDALDTYNAIIDEEKCIECGLCHKICQVNTQYEFNKPVFWKQGWAKDSIVRAMSSSGGVAQEIELAFVKNGGVVCSCVFNKGIFGFKFAETEDQVREFKGSKYVKSSPIGIYEELKHKLKSGNKILFVGLPCQVGAAENYVGTALKANLYTLDLICHGTPSPKILSNFLTQYNLNIEELSDIQFRKKAHFQLKENEQYIGVEGTLDKYSIAFLNSICYTENCYSCQFARLERISDITLGDSWGTNLPMNEQKLGISLILCQTPKGRQLIEMSDLILLNVDLKTAVDHNHQLKYPSKKPDIRDDFFERVRKSDRFNLIIKKCYPKQCFKQVIKGILIKLKILNREGKIN